MKKLSILLITLSFFLHVANAQKRNNIKVIGIGFDNSLKATKILNEISENETGLQNPFITAHAFNWGGFGYERLLGTHVAIGASYWKYFDAESGELNCYDAYNDFPNPTKYTVYYQPVSVPNSYFQYFTYKVSGFSLGFESKYFFKAHTDDGANGVYLASSYQLTQVKHEFTNATYADTTNGSNNSISFIKPFDATTTYLNKIGLKIGVAGSAAISADLFIGVNYIIPGNFSQFYESPLTSRAYNIQIGLNLGVPY